MKRNLLILAIILLIGFIVNSCGDDEQPQPTQQSKTWSGITTIGGTANIIVNYVALPGVTPSYMSNLEAVIQNIIPGSTANGNFTINVIAGNSGFVLASSKTLSVGESWITGKSEDEIGSAMMGVRSSWLA